MDKGLYIEKNISFNLLLEKLKENNFIKGLKKDRKLYKCVFSFKGRPYDCEINPITGDIKFFDVNKKSFFSKRDLILMGKIGGDGSFILVNTGNAQSPDKIFYENKNGLVFEHYKSGSIYE